MVQLIPGDPARRIAGPNAPLDYVNELRVQLGLDDPLVVQLVDYVRRVLTLDLGVSFRTNQPVSTVLADRFPLSLELAGAALVVALLISVATGLLAAMHTRGDRHPRFESFYLLTTGGFAALPEFLLATFLVYLFTVTVPLFPLSSSDGWSALVLPALAVSLPPAAMLSRIVRVQALEVLRSDYIRTARSKRLPAGVLYLRHALPNVLTSVLTIGSLMFVSLLGGSVVVENIFAWPGLGTAIVDAILARDYPVVQGAILGLGVLVLVVNTGVDVVLALLDPRATIRAA